MRVSVASGKGGTGKTTVSLMLAAGAEQATLIDCDVEEPNCHLFVKPDNLATETVNVRIPDILAERCDGCGDCVKVCRFSALVVAGGTAMLSAWNGPFAERNPPPVAVHPAALEPTP